MQKASGRSICTEHGRKKGRGGFLQNPWQELPTYSTSFHSHKNINRISIDVVTRTQGGRAGIPASCLVYFILRMEIPRGEELCLAITLLACSPICLSKPRQTLSAGCMDERKYRQKEGGGAQGSFQCTSEVSEAPSVCTVGAGDREMGNWI